MSLDQRNPRNDTGNKIMLNPSIYLDILKKNNVNFFCGVPDSLLKDFCACLTDTVAPGDHIITANEGGAIGLAIGHHLGSGKLPLVYMQNSGFGNTVNPLLSLASNEVYATPMLLMIGWRGEPGIKDEPQHVHQGRVMRPMLDSMEIPNVVLSDDIETAAQQTYDAARNATENKCPVAIIVKKGTFDSYSKQLTASELRLSREEAIISIAEQIENEAAIVCTTGMASRELFEHRVSTNSGHHRDFLTVGGMGHASQIALGISMSQPNRKVYCLDGDGAALMHLGSLAISGQSGCQNFVHIILNNGVHGSVGGQPTVGFKVDFCDIARAMGYKYQLRVSAPERLAAVINETKNMAGPVFVEIRTSPENRKDIGRPTASPNENKTELMAFLRDYT